MTTATNTRTTTANIGLLRTALGPDGYHRPTDRPVRNDGIAWYWLRPLSTYRLAWDGTGFRVASPTFNDGHVRRLVDLRGALAYTFWMDIAATGRTDWFVLDRKRAYLITPCNTGGWALGQEIPLITSAARH